MLPATRRSFVGGRRVRYRGTDGSFTPTDGTAGSRVFTCGTSGNTVPTRDTGTAVKMYGLFGTGVTTRPARTITYVMVIVGVTSIVAFADTVVDGIANLSR